MTNLVILISGRGSNMIAIADACRREGWPARIAAVIAHGADVPGLQAARALGLPTDVVDGRAHPERAGREAALAEFNAAVRRIPEVEECHMIASSFDYLLKVRTADIRKYRIVLGEKISNLPHVASTSTFVAMETVRESAR